jgi:hypothetical protein
VGNAIGIRAANDASNESCPEASRVARGGALLKTMCALFSTKGQRIHDRRSHLTEAMCATIIDIALNKRTTRCRLDLDRCIREA